jgi:WD40 repeat protein
MLGTKDGDVDVVDCRAGARQRCVSELHAKKMNTVHMDPSGGNMMVTSSTDRTVKVWDVRMLVGGDAAVSRKARPVCWGEHLQTCQSAYFSPDGSQRVLSTSMDNTVVVWWSAKESLAAGSASTPTLTKALTVPHNNQTGRWVIPLRAVWTPHADAFVVGSMTRRVDVFRADSGASLATLESESMTAIAARVCVHPVLPALACGTGSGRLHVFL